MTSLNKNEASKDRFGISKLSFCRIQRVLRDFSDIERVVIFGSRANGTCRKGSDIDLAIYGQHLQSTTAWQLETELNERIPIPYHVDVVAPQYSSHTELKAHVDRVGKVFYEQNSIPA
jgi:predicted nucleotidyltransferase